MIVVQGFSIAQPESRKSVKWYTPEKDNNFQYAAIFYTKPLNL